MESKYILDIGCRIGRTACSHTEKCGFKVIGVDISEKMIEQAKQRSNKNGLDDFVEFRVGDTQNFPLEMEYFGYGIHIERK